MTKFAHVQGFVEPGFGKVAEAFERNFAEHGELGAGFALYAGGRQVVDIWGGIADKASGRAWDIDTLQLVFSTTKGATAICVAKLVGEGRLSYDDKVAQHWPEFADEGKEGITVGELVSHQAGPAVGARHGPRLPRADLRLVGGRGRAASRRPVGRALLRRGDRRAARA